jgi:hypothetical protein
MAEGRLVATSALRPNRPRRSRAARRTYARQIFAAAGAIVLLASFSIASNTTAAGVASLSKSTIFKAPFGGNTSTFTVLASSGDCGFKERFSTAPGINVTTGAYKGTANATARSCGPTEVFSQVELAPGIYPSNLIIEGIGGARSVELFWAITYNYTLTALATAGAFANASVSFYDGSAVLGGSVVFSNGPGVEAFTTAGTVSSAHTIHLTAYINTTFTKDRQYTIFPQLYAYVDASASPGGAQAFASLNLRTDGNEAKLTKIVVT